jgi:predicted  nucleic acid-binding Zn-ribbon protein
MKKTILTLIIATAFFTGVIFNGCSPATPKEEAARAKVDDANEELKDARKAATAEEWKAFKDESELKIRDNEIRIAELKTKIKKSGKELDAVYERKIDALEQQNKAMKVKIDVYEKDVKSDWDSFKREFNHDMDEIGKAMLDLTVDNKK